MMKGIHDTVLYPSLGGGVTLALEAVKSAPLNVERQSHALMALSRGNFKLLANPVLPRTRLQQNTR